MVIGRERSGWRYGRVDGMTDHRTYAEVAQQ
jgi:hypothetical protein